MLAALVPVMAQFLPDDGPVSPTFFVVLLGLGFLIGTLGHIIKSRTLVIAGILLIFASTVFLPLAYSLSN